MTEPLEERGALAPRLDHDDGARPKDVLYIETEPEDHHDQSRARQEEKDELRLAD